jgi:hypothetical protein
MAQQQEIAPHGDFQAFGSLAVFCLEYPDTGFPRQRPKSRPKVEAAQLSHAVLQSSTCTLSLHKPDLGFAAWVGNTGTHFVFLLGLN